MKDLSQANRGKILEDFLKFVHEQYQRQKIACVHKVPTEFIPIRNAKGKVVDCKVEEKSCVDYLGRYRCIPVAVEAKHESDARIAFSRVEPHQAAYMDLWTADPRSVGLVLVSFKMQRYFAIPWIFWKVARDEWEHRPRGTRKAKEVKIRAYGYEWETTGMASVSADQLLPEWEIKPGGAMGLPYLHIIDNFKRKERNE